MDQVVFDGGHYGFIEGPEKLLRLLTDGVTADRPSTGPAGGRSEEAC
jgi:hypothetical protein